jgi:hypothetical protein
MTTELKFVRQQGFVEATDDSCAYQYPALMWQPRVMGALVLVGLALQAAWYFIVMSMVLWWNAALPELNVFDLLYNRLIARSNGPMRLGPAPAPRRFAQAVAGSLLLAIGISLHLGFAFPAAMLQIVFVTALLGVIFGRFCAGAYVFLICTGQWRLAGKTLPWACSE